MTAIRRVMDMGNFKYFLKKVLLPIWVVFAGISVFFYFEKLWFRDLGEEPPDVWFYIVVPFYGCGLVLGWLLICGIFLFMHATWVDYRDRRRGGR